MNLKSIGYIVIILSVISCCMLVSLSYFFQNLNALYGSDSSSSTILDLACLAIPGFFTLGVALIIFSNLSDKQKMEKQEEKQQREAEQRRINKQIEDEENKKREDEIIQKWIKKKPKSD